MIESDVVDDEDWNLVPDREEKIPLAILCEDKEVVTETNEVSDRILEIDQRIEELRAEWQERVDMINKKYDTLMLSLRNKLEFSSKEPQNVAL